MPTSSNGWTEVARSGHRPRPPMGWTGIAQAKWTRVGRAFPQRETMLFYPKGRQTLADKDHRCQLLHLDPDTATPQTPDVRDPPVRHARGSAMFRLVSISLGHLAHS